MFADKIKTSAAAVLCVSLLSGCASLQQRDNMTVSSVANDYTKRHPIVLSEQEQVLDVPVASGAQRLNYATLSNIQAFTQKFQTSGTGTIVLMMPSGSANSSAANFVQGQVVQAIEQGGQHRNNIAIQSYDASRHGSSAPIRLSFRSVTASTGQCGQWPEDLSNTPENENYADFGCSTQNNLAAQISNPGDLLGPRKETPIDAENRGNVIADYQG
ncbi:CpaD family pilus assembly protein [Ahrensia kielensis]|uniref:CpaD family pilus assembly protein n=1 Tax=Ahrensia kielensis TaxID=76980 RepID=UPI0003798D61|nr:CpaD family pilus assembly lipoprotein [Ahrensia kielensis]